MSKKRDEDVRRMILAGLRDGDTPAALKQMEARDAELVTYNSGLLVDSGFIEGEAIRDGVGQYASVIMVQLTDTGHDLLEKLEAQTGNIAKSMTIPGSRPLSVFISHSSKDTELAAALVDLLRNAFNLPAPQIRCSSVNGYRLPVGASAEEQLRREVHDARVFIGLITPSSVESAYVMFELGARWGAHLHLAPLLGAGADSSYLRGPLNSLNALDCADPAQVHQLIENLSEPLGVTEHPQASAYERDIEKIVEVSKRHAGPSHLSQAIAKATKIKVPAPVVLEPEEQKVICFLAKYDGSSSSGVRTNNIADNCGLETIEARHFASKLEERGFIEQAALHGEDAGIFRLTPKGREYVVKNRLH